MENLTPSAPTAPEAPSGEKPTVSPPSPLAVTPLPPTPPSRPKWPWILLGLLLLLAIGTGGIFLGRQMASTSQVPIIPQVWPTPEPILIPNPTSNWKTYTDDTYGFSFKYPSEFQDVYLRMNKNDNYADVLNLTAPNHTLKLSVIHDIDIYKNATIEVVAGRETNDAEFKGELKIKPLGSYPSASMTLASVPPVTKVFIAKPQANVYVVVTFAPADSEKNNKLLDQILSTFKFTDQTNQVDTSSWKTYVPTPAKYTIKYPKEWYIDYYNGDEEPKGVMLTSISDGVRTGECDTCTRVSILYTPHGVLPTDEQPVSINGYSGTRRKEATPQGEEDQVSLRNLDGAVADIWLTYPLNKSGKEKQIFTQILSTFHFLK